MPRMQRYVVPGMRQSKVIHLLFPVFGNLKVCKLWNDAKVNFSKEDDKRKSEQIITEK